MHPFAQIRVARARQLDLQPSRHSSRATIHTIVEAPQALESVTEDPFIDGLDHREAKEWGVDVGGSPGALAERAPHYRQRTRVVASLLALPAPTESSHRR